MNQPGTMKRQWAFMLIVVFICTKYSAFIQRMLLGTSSAGYVASITVHVCIFVAAVASLYSLRLAIILISLDTAVVLGFFTSWFTEPHIIRDIPAAAGVMSPLLCSIALLWWASYRETKYASAITLKISDKVKQPEA